MTPDPDQSRESRSLPGFRYLPPSHSFVIAVTSVNLLAVERHLHDAPTLVHGRVRGDVTLTLSPAADGAFEGRLAASAGGEACRVTGALTVDEDDEWSVEGRIVCPQGRSDFDFSEDEDGEFMLLVVPYDAADVPRLDLAEITYARRVDPAEIAERRAGSGEGSVQRDPRLVGLWATQVVTSSSTGSMTTQLVMELRADGTIIDHGSRSVGGIPGVHADTGLTGGGDVAWWQTAEGVLHVSADGSRWVGLATYEISADRVLFVYYDGDRKLWHRQ